jgi:predicted GNAT family N-acyltransferase
VSVALRSVLAADEEISVLALAAQVNSSYAAFQQGLIDFPELHENIMQLAEFISSRAQKATDADTTLSTIDPETLRNLREAHRFWRTRSDSDFARRLIKGEACISDHPLHDQVAALVKRELEVVSGVPLERILFVGSGPFPISAIHLHLQTGLPVDSLARDRDELGIDQDALGSCGLEGGVDLLTEEEARKRLAEYDLVLVGLLFKPKKTILQLLRKRCRTGCQILCRTSHGPGQLLYEPLAERDMRGFHRKRLQISGAEQEISTWLLEAAASAATDLRMEWLARIDGECASQLVCLLNRTLQEETTIGYPGPIDEETGRTLMCQLDKDLQSGHRHVLVASKGDRIVGQLILSPNSSPNHRHIVELTRGTIDPSFRGGGLALRAFQEVAKKCDELGREVICLDVRAGTHAAIWWQHFGFKQYGLLQDYSRVGDKRYQGLYLTQTTAELKKRLAELATSKISQPAFPTG